MQSKILLPQTMLKSKLYLYVGFMCHQAVEKMLKAHYATQTEDVPRTHNLNRLAMATGLFEDLSDDQKNLINTLSPLNIEARYSSEKEEWSKFLTHERCQNLITETEELIAWIKTQLSL